MGSYGIMQGRLTPSNGRGIQFFPFENWKQEFDICASVGVDEIEWIFDYEAYENNPLWTEAGSDTVRDAIDRTGVAVLSVCFDYFMRRPFFKSGAGERQGIRSENIDFVKRIVDGMKRINACLLEIPMVDDSSVKTAEERKLVVDFLHDVLTIADNNDILIGCETDMPVGFFRDFLDEVGHPRIRANYDSGNSSGLGYNHSDEIHSLSDYIANVHIKDRVLHGTTVELGTGNADFDQVFGSLSDIGYKGSIILQAARGEDGKEADIIRSQLEFVKDYSRRFGLEAD